MNDAIGLPLDIKEEPVAGLPQDIQMASDEKSDLVEEYHRLMRGPAFGPIDQDELASQLLRNGIKYSREHSQEQLRIVAEEYSSNWEALKLNVSYGFFCASLSLLNVDAAKTFSHSAESSAGAFGSVEKRLVDGVLFAVKSIRFREEQFAPVLRDVVKECLLLKVASALRVGPNARSIFGFDIVAFRNCFDFSMEFCEDVSFRGIPHSLQRSLSVLHRLQVVHLDIKPENIAFSPSHNDFVFLDFGLSRAIGEGLGRKSLTRFTGSFVFCCSQMLQLYTNDTAGLVDLYYNDAYALHSTLQNILKKDPQLNRVVKEEINDMEYESSLLFCSNGILSSNPNENQNFANQNYNVSFNDFDKKNRKTNEKNLFKKQKYYTKSKDKFDQNQQIILRKYKFFVLSYQLDYTVQNLKCIADEINKPFMRSFIFALPQRIKLISQCKQYLRQSEQQVSKPPIVFSQSETSDSNSLPSIFHDRFGNMMKVNNQSNSNGRTDNNDDILLSPQLVKKCKSEVYLIALTKFIRVNSHHTSFQKKIIACQVFNQLYLKQPIPEDNFQLYRNVTKWLFLTSLSSKKPQRHQILRNCVQTVVVLEIVPEDKFIQAYFTLYQWQLQFIPTVRLAFEFITTLEFVKEKYRTTYNYERLLNTFLAKLNKYVDSIRFFLADQQQIMISQDIKMIINRITTIMQNSQTIEQFLHQERLAYSYQAKKLNLEMKMYMASKQLFNSINTIDFFDYETFELILTKVCRLSSYSSRFTFVHLTIYHVLCLSQEISKTQGIYQHFQCQFSPHKEGTFFGIYFIHQVNRMKLAFSMMCLSERNEYYTKMMGPKGQTIQFKEILGILDWMIKKTNKFYFYLRYLILNLSVDMPIYPNELWSLIKLNINKILKLSNKYHKMHQRHNNDLKIEISVYNSVKDFTTHFQNQNLIDQNQRISIDTRQVFADYYDTINSVECFQCKVLALFQLKAAFAYTHVIISQSRQNFLGTVDSMIFALKHRELRQRVLPLMVLLIRVSILKPEYVTKFDLKALFYEYVRQFDRPHYYLTNIKQYNIFLGIYVMLNQQYPEHQMMTFVQSIAKSLRLKRSTILIDRFYYSLCYLVNLNKNQQAYGFKLSHDNIIKGLFCRLKEDKNPYLALYFSALLEINIKSGIEGKMLRFICLSLNSLSSYAKRIVLNHYYQHFWFYHSLPKRKRYYLKINHLKNCFDLMPLKLLIKTKIKRKVCDIKHHKKHEKLKLFGGSYHKNLANIR